MSDLSRRDFIQRSTAAAAACAVPASAVPVGKGLDSFTDKKDPKVKKYKPFGKTGFMVGDISSGAGQRDPALIERMFESGVNLIDTAYGYPGHEEMIGKVLPKWRDKIFVVSKWNYLMDMATVTKQKLLDELDVTLKRLKTDYVDCMMIHAIGHPDMGGMERMQNPALYEAWEDAKKSGKVRFTGASSCGVKMLDEMHWGVDNDKFDVILLGANFMTHGLEPLLKKAREKSIATMAMKTMTIFKTDLNIKGLMDKSTNARQAVIKYVLGSSLFDTMIISMRNFDQINEYLAVSGQTKLDSEEVSMLNIMKESISKEYCRPGCDSCHGSCPKNVPVANILRYKMYFENYGDEKRAMTHYKRLPDSRNASVCENCNAPCEGNCRFGIPVKEKLLEAHTMLTLA